MEPKRTSRRGLLLATVVVLSGCGPAGPLPADGMRRLRAWCTAARAASAATTSTSISRSVRVQRRPIGELLPPAQELSGNRRATQRA